MADSADIIVLADRRKARQLERDIERLTDQLRWQLDATTFMIESLAMWHDVLKRMYP